MSRSIERFKDFYTNPFRQFLAKIDPLGDFGYPYGVFLSHPLPEYDDAQKKVFYIGIDPNGWFDYSEMMDYFHQDKVQEYLDKQWPTSAEDMMKWGNGMTFWTVVYKLHIYLNHRVLLPTIQDYSAEQKRCLLGLGFGNMNCVETRASLLSEKVLDPETEEKMPLWECIDENKYWLFKKSSRDFDRLKYILDLYAPDLVFIFTWRDDPEYFQALELIEDKSLYKEHWRSVYSIRGYKTKLIWTSHPTYFARRITRDVNEVVKFLGDTALSL